MQNEKAYELVTTGSDGINRLSPRNGFNGFLRALLGDRAFLPPSLAKRVRKLDISVGMSGPHDFAVHELALSSKHQSRPPHPVPTFVTIAKRPSVARDGNRYSFDLGESGKDLFLQPGLDGANQIDLAQ